MSITCFYMTIITVYQSAWIRVAGCKKWVGMKIVFGLSGSENKNKVLFVLFCTIWWHKPLCSTETCPWTDEQNFQSHYEVCSVSCLAYKWIVHGCCLTHYDCKMEKTPFFGSSCYTKDQEKTDLTERLQTKTCQPASWNAGHLKRAKLWNICTRFYQIKKVLKIYILSSKC